MISRQFQYYRDVFHGCWNKANDHCSSQHYAYSSMSIASSEAVSSKRLLSCTRKSSSSCESRSPGLAWMMVQMLWETPACPVLAAMRKKTCFRNLMPRNSMCTHQHLCSGRESASRAGDLRSLSWRGLWLQTLWDSPKDREAKSF